MCGNIDIIKKKKRKKKCTGAVTNKALALNSSVS